LVRIIPDAGSQQQVTLSLESISTIPFQAWASNVTMPKLRLHSSSRRMQGFVNVFGTSLGTWYQADKNDGALFWGAADIISNITNREIQQAGMLIAQKDCQVSLGGCTTDWHNCRSSRKLILCIPPPITGVHLAVYSTTLRDCEVHRFEIQVCLQSKMCYEKLDIFENIPVV